MSTYATDRATPPVIRYPRARLRHHGRMGVKGWVAMCGRVPNWHTGAEPVEGDITCGSCLAGLRRFPSR